MMNPVLMVILLLVVSGFAASVMNIPPTAALLFAAVGFLLWASVGSVTRRYYQSRNHLDELRRQDIPMMLWWLSMGSIGFGMHDASQGSSHPGDMGGGWSGDGGSMGDGGGGGFGDGGGSGGSSN